MTPVGYIFLTNWLLQLYSKDSNLDFHAIHGMFVNFVHEWQNLLSNVDSERCYCRDVIVELLLSRCRFNEN